MVLCISPITALIADQVHSLQKHGISSIHVSEQLADNDIEAIHEGKYQILFFSPEELLSDEKPWRDMLLTPGFQENLVAFVIDETHCVKKW